MTATYQVACPACGTGNRVPSDGPAEDAKCGRCKERLFTGVPIEVDDALLKKHLDLTSGLIVLDVWAPWCAPCRMMAPNFAEAARRLGADARFLKLNSEENDSGERLDVRSIPALILFAQGREITRQVGLMNTEQIVAWAQAHIARG